MGHSRKCRIAWSPPCLSILQWRGTRKCVSAVQGFVYDRAQQSGQQKAPAERGLLRPGSLPLLSAVQRSYLPMAFLPSRRSHPGRPSPAIPPSSPRRCPGRAAAGGVRFDRPQVGRLAHEGGAVDATKGREPALVVAAEVVVEALVARRRCLGLSACNACHDDHLMNHPGAVRA
jgi:hypothetical protein